MTTWRHPDFSHGFSLVDTDLQSWTTERWVSTAGTAWETSPLSTPSSGSACRRRGGRVGRRMSVGRGQARRGEAEWGVECRALWLGGDGGGGGVWSLSISYYQTWAGCHCDPPAAEQQSERTEDWCGMAAAGGGFRLAAVSLHGKLCHGRGTNLGTDWYGGCLAQLLRR